MEWKKLILIACKTNWEGSRGNSIHFFFFFHNGKLNALNSVQQTFSIVGTLRGVTSE